MRDASAPYNRPYSLAFPVIVVDSPLLQCSLAQDGSIGLEEVTQGEFLFFAGLPRSFGSCIRVVTADHISEFAIEAKQVATRIRDELKHEETKVRELWREQISMNRASNPRLKTDVENARDKGSLSSPRLSRTPLDASLTFR